MQLATQWWVAEISPHLHLLSTLRRLLLTANNKGQLCHCASHCQNVRPSLSDLPLAQVESYWGLFESQGQSFVWHIQGHLWNVWWGWRGHLRRVLELQFSMQRGEGGRACDIHREPRPSLTSLYNSSPGIWGTSNLGSFPPKKRSENLFTLTLY